MHFCEIWCYSALPAHIVRQTPKEARLHMKTSESYLPEGSYMVQPAVRQAFSTLGALRQARDEGRILEAVAQRCTAAHDLLFDLGIAQGILPRVSCALGVAEGDTREIAILSRVGKPTCFVVTDIDESTDPPTAWLSRTIVQQKAQDRLLDSLRPGDVIPARVTHLEPFGAFVDAGCGVPSLIGIENSARASATVRMSGAFWHLPSGPIDRRHLGSPFGSCPLHRGAGKNPANFGLHPPRGAGKPKNFAHPPRASRHLGAERGAVLRR